MAESPVPVRPRSFVPLGATCVAVGVANALAVPFLSVFLTGDVGVQPVPLGAFLLATPVAGVVVSTVIGRLSDTRTDRRLLLRVGGVAGAIGYSLYVFLRDYWALLAVSTTLVAVASALIPQMFAFARHAVLRSGTTKGPLIISGLRTLISVSWVAGPPLAALLVAVSGFRGLFGAVAVCYALATVLTFRLPDPGTVAHDPTKPRVRPGPLPRQVWFAAPAFVLIQGAGSLGVMTLPLFVAADHGGGPADAGLILGLCAALEIPLMIWLGVLAIKADQHLLVLTGAVVALGYHTAMYLTGSLWQVAAAQVLNAVVIASVAGVGISYFQSLAPDRPGTATTLYTNTTVAGSMIAGPLLGVAAKLGYRDSYLMSLVMAGLGAFLLALARPRRVSPVRSAAGA
ncbi:sugar efflux transporter [Actinokineospora enzanensis]|uniref:sugar efflux transporter n=1 Tax=Actinokineospora enzanensis TaxID=155975 RepID=UPI0007C4DB40|nr:sugar efflux transporter [Actinokineospora enzanensis]